MCATTVWAAWHPENIALRLSDVEVPWAVAAGWALDLFLGEQTREHGDLEIAVPAPQFGAVRERLFELEFFEVDDGTLRPLAPDAEPAAHTHQTWARDPVEDRWRLDVFREPSDGDDWLCPRRAWLVEALDRVHPGHPWLDVIDQDRCLGPARDPASRG